MSYVIGAQATAAEFDANTSAEQTEGVVKQVAIFSGTTPAAAGTHVETAVTGLGPFKTASIVAQLIGATGGTLDLYLQGSSDGGTTWYDIAHFAQLASGAGALNKVFSISKGAITALTTTGIGTLTTPAVGLAAATVVSGDFGDRIRLVEVTGAGASAGAAIVIQATLTT